MAHRFQGRRLSPLRLLVVLAVVGTLVAGSTMAYGRARDAALAGQQQQWFGSYVDATSTPFYDIGTGVAAGERVVLAFAVAHPERACEPSWGGYYTLDEAAATFDLDRRAARVRGAGGEIVISTGGLLNDEPATACDDVGLVRDAYASLLDRYQSSTLDLDIEGDDLADAASGERRASAVAALQKDRDDAGTGLEVWLTLPVATGGLTAEGLAEVRRMLEAGVDLAGVNLMTMNFGESRAAGQSMATASIQSARSTHAQLTDLYAGAGQELGSQSMWRKIGLTPMIGQNDLLGEVFGLDDAVALNAFAVETGVGRISLWSANRDNDCGPNHPDPERVSNNCSGVKQAPRDFAQRLAAGFDPASTASAAAAATPRASEEPAPKETAIVDDPATSPYPIWNDEAAFVEGDRVVWRGNVYESKWWNQDTPPDSPVANGGATPWTLVGPVLPGDKPQPVVTAPAGLYPAWTPSAVYTEGDRVLHEGRILEAKWWNSSESPEAALRGAPTSPWKLFTNVQAQRIIDAAARK
ncbi:MAG: carbohydrate-binding protein, partial [Arthrobacter sp.]|uniref:chitinase n=1 Tax=Arthrobacter sp. TaxID=1667 RepID=UPI00346FA9EA